MSKLFNLVFYALITMSSTVTVAQNKPTVEIVVGTNPGGPQDIVARQLHKALIAVDNSREYIVTYRSGAAGSIAYAYVTKPQPNNNIIIMSVGQLSEITLNKDLAEIRKEMRLIGPLWSSPGVVAVSLKSGINSMADLIKRGREGKLTCGAASRLIKLNLDYLAQEMKFRDTEVIMFKGTTDGLTLLAKGDLDCWLDALHGPVHGFSQSGQIKIIALSENQPHPVMPNTFLAKNSLPGNSLFHYSWWAGLGIAETNTQEFRNAIGNILSQAMKHLEATDTLAVIPVSRQTGAEFINTAQAANRLNQQLIKK